MLDDEEEEERGEKLKSRIKVRVGMNEEENGLDDFLKKKKKSNQNQNKLTSPTAVDAVEDAE